MDTERKEHARQKQEQEQEDQGCNNSLQNPWLGFAVGA